MERIIENDAAGYGFLCEDCGHKHIDTGRGGICIGCPCPRTAPDVRQAFMQRIKHASRAASQEER